MWRTAADFDLITRHCARVLFLILFLEVKRKQSTIDLHSTINKLFAHLKWNFYLFSCRRLASSKLNRARSKLKLIFSHSRHVVEFLFQYFRNLFRDASLVFWYYKIIIESNRPRRNENNSTKYPKIFQFRETLKNVPKERTNMFSDFSFLHFLFFFFAFLFFFGCWMVKSSKFLRLCLLLRECVQKF